jgi:hypothetical protein
MVRLFTNSVMILSVVAGGLGLASIPAQAQQASFQSSCTNIAIVGATITATCRRADGTFNQTSIVLSGIANVNGRLTQTGGNSTSTFQSSCQNVQVVGSTLTANCRQQNGSFANSSVLIPGITNNNGVLQFM